MEEEMINTLSYSEPRYEMLAEIAVTRLVDGEPGSAVIPETKKTFDLNYVRQTILKDGQFKVTVEAFSGVENLLADLGIRDGEYTFRLDVTYFNYHRNVLAISTDVEYNGFDIQVPGYLTLNFLCLVEPELKVQSDAEPVSYLR